VTEAQGVEPLPPPTPITAPSPEGAKDSEEKLAPTVDFQSEEADRPISREGVDFGARPALVSDSDHTPESEGDYQADPGYEPVLSELVKELSNPLLSDQLPEEVNQVLTELSQNLLLTPISRIGITRPPHKLGKDD
ncbi:MAG: hypothetical protein ACE1ZJ_00905, partial [Nitrospirales bacterium]